MIINNGVMAIDNIDVLNEIVGEHITRLVTLVPLVIEERFTFYIFMQN